MRHCSSQNIFCILATFFFGSLSHLLAQGVENPLIDKAWLKVAKLEADILVTGVQGFKPEENYSTKIHWKENANGNFLRKVESSRFGTIEFDVTTAFDGQNYYELNESDKDALLVVDRTIPTDRDIPNFPFGFFPLQPFIFLQTSSDSSGTRGAKNVFPGIKNLQEAISGARFLNVLQDARVEQFNNLEARVIELPGFRYVGEAAKYKIYFSVDGVPRFLGWKSFSDKTGALLDMLTVKKWKSATISGSHEMISYPSEYLAEFYRPGDGALAFSYSAIVDISKIGSESVEEDFVPDVSVADYIYDAQQKTVMPNPK